MGSCLNNLLIALAIGTILLVLVQCNNLSKFVLFGIIWCSLIIMLLSCKLGSNLAKGGGI